MRINDEAGCDTSAFGFAVQFFCLSRFSLFPQNRGIVLQDGRHFRVPAKIPASDSGSARQRGIGFGFSAPPVVRVAERMKDADAGMIPVVQVATPAAGQARERYHEDFDLLLEGDPAEWTGQLLDLILRVAGRDYTPRLFARGNTDFQFTRGLLGVSM